MIDRGQSNDRPHVNGAGRYVLITPARNEEAFIALTLESVIAQTRRPVKWIIVSDGSTDRTDEIVSRHAKENPWIELVRMPERTERHFAGKVHCFNAGYEKLKGVNYDFLASLDADISFEPDYFEFLLSKFAADPALGLAGTPFVEGEGTYDYRFASVEHVSGACQLFRRECFEAIGGYVPVKGGGVDTIAVISARMKGWKTRTFTEKTCTHHRKMGTAKHGLLRARFKEGQSDYVLGGHPLWQALRSVFQMKKKPLVLGGCMLAAGYFSALLRRTERPVSAEFIRFHRQEQVSRLKRIIAGPKLQTELSPA